jgi:hypothetical protein
LVRDDRPASPERDGEVFVDGHPLHLKNPLSLKFDRVALPAYPTGDVIEVTSRCVESAVHIFDKDKTPIFHVL